MPHEQRPGSSTCYMSLLPCIEIEPKTAATATVIWLHGLGADGNDFVPIIPELQLPSHMAVRFVFPLHTRYH